jgi:hypothetical protein
VTAEAFPLQWPAGRKRTEHWRREAARFDTTLGRARDNVVREVELLTGGRLGPESNLVLSTNLELRRDGLPYANQRQPEDTGVAIYFTYKKREMSFACDRWLKIEHNMQAIAKTIEALRGIDRWGTGDMLEAAFTGFLALPAPTAPAPWRSVLSVSATALLPEVEAAYRNLRSIAHRSADTDRFMAVNAAWEQAQRELA